MKTPQVAVTWSALLCTPASHWEHPASTLGPKVRDRDRFLVVLPVTPVKTSRVGMPYSKTKHTSSIRPHILIINYQQIRN